MCILKKLRQGILCKCSIFNKTFGHSLNMNEKKLQRNPLVSLNVRSEWGQTRAWFCDNWEKTRLWTCHCCNRPWGEWGRQTLSNICQFISQNCAFHFWHVDFFTGKPSKLCVVLAYFLPHNKPGTWIFSISSFHILDMPRYAVCGWHLSADTARMICLMWDGGYEVRPVSSVSGGSRGGLSCDKQTGRHEPSQEQVNNNNGKCYLDQLISVSLDQPNKFTLMLKSKKINVLEKNEWALTFIKYERWKSAV